jgi:hypothetical protein
MFENVSKIEQIFKYNTPSISEVRKDFGRDFIIAYLKTWIINLNDFINVKMKMNKVQTEETARLIVKEFYCLTITDIYFVFESAKRGLYGKFYDRIDGTMILEWFRNHFKDRCNAFEKKLLEEDLRKKESRINYQESLIQQVRKKNSEILGQKTVDKA